ncbi:alkaline shock response membrane anchor protein AmaP [Nocardia sp. NBC_00416]|uniref:alkaline shock response membrane anchor protein AmaP n=1 Tax=Nocardia sp. NBC_00416 TaxID=2975991 RepID=UPI002E1BCDB0
MTRADRPAALNRILLALVGALLVAVGALGLAAHFGRLGGVDTDSGLVPGTAAPPTWVFWAVVVGAVVLGLLCLRWLFAQFFRMPKPVSWRLEAPEAAGTTVLDSGTAAAPVAADIESFPEVRTAKAWLSGPCDSPELRLVVTAEPYADIAALRRRILDDAVARLGRALDFEDITVQLELRFADAGRPAPLR